MMLSLLPLWSNCWKHNRAAGGGRRHGAHVMSLWWLTLTHLPLDKMAVIFTDDIFKLIFMNENDIILIQISLRFVPRSLIDNNPSLVRVMAWRRTGNNPLPEPMLIQSPGARGRWFNLSSGETLKLLYCFDIWQASRQYICRGTCHISCFQLVHRFNIFTHFY